MLLISPFHFVLLSVGHWAESIMHVCQVVFTCETGIVTKRGTKRDGPHIQQYTMSILPSISVTPHHLLYCRIW